MNLLNNSVRISINLKTGGMAKNKNIKINVKEPRRSKKAKDSCLFHKDVSLKPFIKFDLYTTKAKSLKLTNTRLSRVGPVQD